MRVAVASGKGGTGKTTLATSLALVWSQERPLGFIDCDVEGPNADLLLNPRINTTREVSTLIPTLREDLCQYCGDCADFCRYHALAVVGEKWMLFPELCHSCGGCTLLCPTAAIIEKPRVVGEIREGEIDGIQFSQGILGEGETQPVPVIEALVQAPPPEGDIILDSPPGASCSMITVARAADIVLLVTEPTPFGLHDLSAAVEALRDISIPMGVVVNRADWGDGSVRDFCSAEKIPILLEIPHFRRAAEAYARAVPLVSSVPKLWDDLLGLRSKLEQLIEGSSR